MLMSGGGLSGRGLGGCPPGKCCPLVVVYLCPAHMSEGLIRTTRHGGKTGLNSPCVFGPAIHLYWRDIWRQQETFADNGLACLRNYKLGAKWIKEAAIFMTQKLHVPPTWAPWTPRKRCYGVPRLERVYKVIDCAYEARMQER